MEKGGEGWGGMKGYDRSSECEANTQKKIITTA